MQLNDTIARKSGRRKSPRLHVLRDAACADGRTSVLRKQAAWTGHDGTEMSHLATQLCHVPQSAGSKPGCCPGFCERSSEPLSGLMSDSGGRLYCSYSCKAGFKSTLSRQAWLKATALGVRESRHPPSDVVGQEGAVIHTAVPTRDRVAAGMLQDGRCLPTLARGVVAPIASCPVPSTSSRVSHQPQHSLERAGAR